MSEVLNRDGTPYAPRDRSWVKIALSAFEELNTPRSLSRAICLRYGDFESFYNLDINPLEYSDDKAAFERDFKAHELLRKCEFFGFTPEYRRSKALDKGASAEDRCYATNRKMITLQFSRDPKGPGSRIRAIRQKIAKVLGEFDLTELIDNCRWGPGSDTLNKRPFTAPYFKYEGRISVTRRASDFLAVVLDDQHMWARWLADNSDPGSFVPLAAFPRGDVCITVPKTAKTARP